MDLLIVDDEASLRDFLSIVFEEEGWRVETAGSLAAARLAHAKHEPDLILCDLMLPDGSGIDLLREVKASAPSVAVIMITAHTSTKSAVEALKAGAFDYIAKPFDIDELKIIVRNAVERKELEDENIHLRTALEERFTFSNIIGRSARMQEIFSVVQRIAKTTSTGLISGDTKTPVVQHGVKANRKVVEMIAQMSHEQGLTPRRLKLDELYAPSTMDS